MRIIFEAVLAAIAITCGVMWFVIDMGNTALMFYMAHKGYHMYQKGDYIEAEGREIEDRPGKNGTVYHSLTAKDVKPGGLVILRWMQQAIDAMLSASPQEPPMMTETDEETPFDAPATQPVQASMDEYAARTRDEELERQLDATEEDDLPF